MRGKSLLKKLRPGKRVLFFVIALVVVTISIIAFVFLRHRQLCSYQQLIAQGRLINDNGINLCPNISDTNTWPSAVKNAFNISILNGIKQNPISTAALPSAQETCIDQLNPLCWVGDAKPSLQQSDGFTNLLVVGLDTKATTKKLQNTDSIMFISLDHKSGKVMFVSLPRDLYVYYQRPNGVKTSYKINGVFAIDGVTGLNSVVSQIMGKPIHYYAYINLDLFKRMIDRVGGVDIVLDQEFKDRYPCAEVPTGIPCPNRANGFGLFTFPAGPNHFDSFQSLVYTRSRYASSDYDRAKRQQNLLRALMESALNSELNITDRLNLYLNLYQIFQEEVLTNIELKDVAGLFSIIDQVSNKPLQLVADPNLGGINRYIYYLGILPNVGYSIGFKDTSHRQFQAYINKIWDNIAFYTERPKVLVHYEDGKLASNQALQDLINNIPENVELQAGVAADLPHGLRIYMFNKDKEGSAKMLNLALPGSLIFDAELDGIAVSPWGEDILITYAE